MKKIVLFAFWVLMLVGCKEAVPPAPPPSLPTTDTLPPTPPQDSPVDPFALERQLRALMTDKVDLDSIIRAITLQDNVDALEELRIDYDAQRERYIIEGETTRFEWECINDEGRDFPAAGPPNTVLWDGNRRISFADYAITCPNRDDCEDFGFNAPNSPNEAQIVDVAGVKFLYVDLGFRCNGMGCNVVSKMIYDLKYHQPTFIETFNIDLGGFFVSDFDNDSIPDLLVIEKTIPVPMPGFATSQYEMRLHAYKYSKGRFIPNINPRNHKPYLYRLYGIGGELWDIHPQYSRLEENWF